MSEETQRFIKKLLEEIDKKNSWGKRELKDKIMDLMLTHK